jgi:Flp pilus assembly protein TadD
LAVALVGCATPSLTKVARKESASTQLDMPTKRDIQAIRTEPSGVDGQTCWIIEPDVPRIPKIAGLEPQLPPHIERRLSRAFDLAQRGATYSANAEFESVLGLCALELDARSGGTSHRDALRQGWIALKEADELTGEHVDWRKSADVRRAVAGHATPVLQHDMPPAIDSIQAAQLYYRYAEERFAYAGEGLPGASLAYYGLARTIVEPGTHFRHAPGKAAMLQRVALQIAPQNVLAANELGVLLAQHGHLVEAEHLFRQCVATDASPETWQNLAIVCARQGDDQASQTALAAGAALAADAAARRNAALATSDRFAIASPLNRHQSAKSGPANGADDKRDDVPNSENVEQRSGVWAKLDFSSKLPNVFRR